MIPLSLQVLGFTLAWARGNEDYPTKPRGDTVEISRRLHATYRPMVSPALEDSMQE